MKYLIGIDGGGTKTDCAIGDLSGKIIYQTIGKPSNFLIIGVEETVANLFAVIEECLFELKGDFSDVKQVVIGVAGAGRKDKPLVKAGKRYYIKKSKGKLWPRTSACKMNAIDHPFGSGRGKVPKPRIPKRNAPPGAKVGLLRPKRTGKRK